MDTKPLKKNELIVLGVKKIWGQFMSNIKVSVLIPVYNVEKYIKKCLESVINQTLEEIEIICVDDCSTDNSKSIIEEYMEIDSRIKLFSTEKNKGPGAVRNIALREAKGEYIAFLDSDDFLEIKTYEKTYNICKKNNLDCLLFKISTIDDKTKQINENAPYFALKPFDNFNKEIFNYKDTLDFICEICVQVNAKLFKREFIEKNDIRFPEELIFEDEVFFYEFFLKAKRMSILRENLVYYRINRQNSIIGRRNEKFIDIIEIFKKIRELIEDLDGSNILKEKFFNRFIPSIFDRFNQNKSDNKEEFFKKIKNEFSDCFLNNDNFNILNNENKINCFYILTCDNLDNFSNYIADKFNHEQIVDSSIHFIYELHHDLTYFKKDSIEKKEIINSKNNIIEKNKISLDNLNEKLNKVENNLEIKEEQNKEKDKLNLELINKIDILTANINQKDELILKKDYEINDINKNISQLNHEISNINKEIENKNNEINNLEQTKNKLNKELKQKTEENEELNKKLKQKTEENEELNENIQELNMAIEKLNEINKKQEINLNNLNSMNNELSTINNEIFSSNSWKLTKPLRILRRMIKRK